MVKKKPSPPGVHIGNIKADLHGTIFAYNCRIMTSVARTAHAMQNIIYDTFHSILPIPMTVVWI